MCELKAANVEPDLIRALTEGTEPVRRQLHRLENSEFRIAVVGLEKSGKSIFINAWLECDLLPNAGPRCTFTTTQICSVANGEGQRLEVTPYTSDEFDTYVSTLREASQGTDEAAQRAQEDWETINRQRNESRSDLERGQAEH